MYVFTSNIAKYERQVLELMQEVYGDNYACYNTVPEDALCLGVAIGGNDTIDAAVILVACDNLQCDYQIYVVVASKDWAGDMSKLIDGAIKKMGGGAVLYEYWANKHAPDYETDLLTAGFRLYGQVPDLYRKTGCCPKCIWKDDCGDKDVCDCKI